MENNNLNGGDVKLSVAGELIVCSELKEDQWRVHRERGAAPVSTVQRQPMVTTVLMATSDRCSLPQPSIYKAELSKSPGS